GIRDRNVTGVQTCALPILRPNCFIKSCCTFLPHSICSLVGPPSAIFLTLFTYSSYIQFLASDSDTLRALACFLTAFKSTFPPSLKKASIFSWRLDSSCLL